MVRVAVSWGVVVAVLAAGLAWGWSFDAGAVPQRPQDLTSSVDAAWYQHLPLEPAAATQAYLDRIPAQMRARGEAYSDTRLLAFALRMLTLVLATALICFTGLAAAMRRLAMRLTSMPALVDLAVALQYFVALYALSLPAEVYAGFMRPHRFGFSDQPFGAWLGDNLLNWGVLTLFYLVAVVLLYRFVRRSPRFWAVGAVGVYIVLRTLYELLTPNVIEPLTNSFRPLPQGRQQQVIMALARANGIENPRVVVSDASAQSRLLNAHVSGIGGTARITVDDTTLARTSEPMLRAVVAHEIGHYVLYHTAIAVVTDSLLMGVGFAAIALVTAALVRRFGPRWQMQGLADAATIPVLWGCFLMWGFASLPVSNAAARIAERQADLFGLNASQSPHGLAEFMIHDADTARLQPSALEYALFYTHPSDAERIATAMTWRAENARLAAP